MLSIDLNSTDCSSANNSLTTTDSLCKTETVLVEYTKTTTINHTIQYTIQHTQTLYSPTTLIICPTTSSSLTSTPTESPTTITVTTCQEPTTILSGIQQISVLATSGAVICLLIIALMMMWVWTRRTSTKTRNIRIGKTDANISLTLGHNPAYETHAQLHRNVAYEDHTNPGTGKLGESSTSVNTPEPTYEIIPQINNQTKSVTTGKEVGDEYDKLNRGLSRINS